MLYRVFIRKRFHSGPLKGLERWDVAPRCSIQSVRQFMRMVGIVKGNIEYLEVDYRPETQD